MGEEGPRIPPRYNAGARVPLPRPPLPEPADYPPCLSLNLSATDQTSDLAKLLCDPEMKLPQCVRIAEPFLLPGCITKLDKGDALMLHFVYDDPTVIAINSDGENLRLPIHADQEYEILPLDPELDDLEFAGTEALMNASPLPAVVRVLEAHCSCRPDEVQEVGDVILIQGVEMDDERGKLLLGRCDSVTIKYSTELNTSRYTTMPSPKLHKMSKLIHRKFPQRVRIPDLRYGYSKRNLKTEKVLNLIKLSKNRSVVATRNGEAKILSIPVTTPMTIERLSATLEDAHAMITPIYSLVNPTWGLLDPTKKTLDASMQAIPQPLEPVLRVWLCSAEGKEKATEVAEIQMHELEEKLLDANNEMQRMKRDLDFYKNRPSKTIHSTAPAIPARAKTRDREEHDDPPQLPDRPLNINKQFVSDVEDNDSSSDSDCYEYVDIDMLRPVSTNSDVITRDINHVLSKKEKELVDLRRNVRFLESKCENLKKENLELRRTINRFPNLFENLPCAAHRSPNTTSNNHKDDGDYGDYLEPIRQEPSKCSLLCSQPSPGLAVTLPRPRAGWHNHLEPITVDEVGHFLRSIGLQQYADTFSRNYVDGHLLVAMSEHCMHDLGMTHLHARKLKVEISRVLTNA